MTTIQCVCSACYKISSTRSLPLSCTEGYNSFHLKCVPYAARKGCKLLSRELKLWTCQNCLNNVLPFNHLADSDEFMAAISENWFCDSIPAIVELENLNYNPFDYNTIGLHSVMEDVDQDINFFKEAISRAAGECNITLEEQFNTMYEKFKISSGKMLSMLHLNIRSIAKNLHHLRNYLLMIPL